MVFELIFLFLVAFLSNIEGFCSLGGATESSELTTVTDNFISSLETIADSATDPYERRRDFKTQVDVFNSELCQLNGKLFCGSSMEHVNGSDLAKKFVGSVEHQIDSSMTIPQRQENLKTVCRDYFDEFCKTLLPFQIRSSAKMTTHSRPLSVKFTTITVKKQTTTRKFTTPTTTTPSTTSAPKASVQRTKTPTKAKVQNDGGARLTSKTTTEKTASAQPEAQQVLHRSPEVEVVKGCMKLGSGLCTVSLVLIAVMSKVCWVLFD